MAEDRASHDIHKGALLALAAAAISGLSIYVNAFGVKLVPDAAVYTTAKNGVAALILVALAMALGARREIPSLTSRNRRALVMIAIIGGSIPFVLFFSGLAIATAPTAAFIQKTLFIWVAVLAVPFLGERLGLLQVAAMAVLLGGLMLVSPPTGVGWGPGETMIAAATLLWSIEIIVAKRVLTDVSAPLVGAGRMAIGFAILVGYLAISGRLAVLGAMGGEAWLWVLVTGGLLAGYVATWFSALKAAPASMVTSILVAGAVVTGALSSATKGTAPNPGVVSGYLLMVIAVGLLIAVATGRLGHVHVARASDPA